MLDLYWGCAKYECEWYFVQYVPCDCPATSPKAKLGRDMLLLTRGHNDGKQP